MRRFPLVLLALLACHSSRSTRARPRFEDYPVAEHYTGPQAPVDLSSDPGAAEYRTVLREGARQPPDFAGHYVIVTWGCGSPCHSFAIVDVITGRVYMVPFSAMSGADYQLNSSLFVAEPPQDVIELCTESWMKPMCAIKVYSYYYRWDGQRLSLIDSLAVDSSYVE